MSPQRLSFPILRITSNLLVFTNPKTSPFKHHLTPGSPQLQRLPAGCCVNIISNISATWLQGSASKHPAASYANMDKTSWLKRQSPDRKTRLVKTSQAASLCLFQRVIRKGQCDQNHAQTQLRQTDTSRTMLRMRTTSRAVQVANQEKDAQLGSSSRDLAELKSCWQNLPAKKMRHHPSKESALHLPVAASCKINPLRDHLETCLPRKQDTTPRRTQPCTIQSPRAPRSQLSAVAWKLACQGSKTSPLAGFSLAPANRRKF